MLISKEMENIDIDPLRGLLAPSILEWLEDGEQSTSGLFKDCTNVDEFSIAYRKMNYWNWNITH